MLRAYFIMALLFSVLVGTMYFGTVQAKSSIPKPSVPEFILKYVDHSYDVPSTYGIDPYTGKNVLTQSGYHVQNKSVELIIKNQPYDSYSNENGSLIWLYYHVAIKGHFENWKDYNWTSQTINLKTYDSYPPNYISSSENSEYTVITYGLDGNNGTDYDHTLGNVSAGGQVDFRVQAIIGYSTRYNTTFSGPPIGLDPGETYHYYIFTGESSDWSSTQTLTISENQTPTSSPSSTPYSVTPLTEQEIIIGVTIIAVVMGAGLTLLIYLIRRK